MSCSKLQYILKIIEVYIAYVKLYKRNTLHAPFGKQIPQNTSTGCIFRGRAQEWEFRPNLWQCEWDKKHKHGQNMQFYAPTDTL